MQRQAPLPGPINMPHEEVDHTFCVCVCLCVVCPEKDQASSRSRGLCLWHLWLQQKGQELVM